MKTALFIGGTGTISTAITRQLSTMPKWQLYLVNRGNRSSVIPSNVRLIKADVNDESALLSAISEALPGFADGSFKLDCVCDFIGFIPEQVERDWRIFNGRTRQYMYISSASAYLKPCRGYLISEETPLENPYWEYSRNKILCENFLFGKYKEEGFPITVIRPTHTYDERAIPLGVHGNMGSWQVARRMLDGKEVIIHGDGTSLWTMTHNSDLAQGFIGLMANPAAIGEAVQIMSDEAYSWNEIYSMVASALGVELKAVHVSSEFLASHEPAGYDMTGALIGDKANSVVFDLSKLRRLVPSFSPRVKLADGLRSTIENILAHPELQTTDPEFDAWCDRIIAACK
ncbi:MAG: NAD-dependent epimerase/dehydratase family protein [Bacteroidales bacterium]|nr:NAD-dependent epimerase/dehydratase family protein [Bacteroidales bacterium]